MNTPFAASEKVFSVTEITNIIKDLLENSIPQIVVEGEIRTGERNADLCKTRLHRRGSHRPSGIL